MGWFRMAAMTAAVVFGLSAPALASRTAPGKTQTRGEWGVSFKTPPAFEVKTSNDNVLILESDGIHLMVRPAQVASVREARVNAKRGVHSFGFMLDAEEMPVEVKVHGLNAAQVEVSGTNSGNKEVRGRILTISGPGSRGLQIAAVGAPDKEQQVSEALDALAGSVTFNPDKSRPPARGGRRR